MNSNGIISALVLCYLQSALGNGKGNDPDAFQEEASQIYSTIFHKYNERVRPPDNYPGPALVRVTATLYHIRHLDLNKQEMESLIHLNISWRDKRLAWYPYQVNEISANVSTVWSPDIVYSNGAVPPRAMYAPKVTIKHDGLITWNRRESVITLCRTQPGNFNQSCEINLGFATFGYTEAFHEDTAFDLDPFFENHNWEVSYTGLDRISDAEISFVVELISKSWSGSDMADGKNCSMALKYNVNKGDGDASRVWMSLVCFSVLVAVWKNRQS